MDGTKRKETKRKVHRVSERENEVGRRRIERKREKHTQRQRERRRQRERKVREGIRRRRENRGLE